MGTLLMLQLQQAALAPPAPAAPAPATGKNGARPADEPPTPQAGEGAKAGPGDPAPSEGAMQRQAASKPGSRQRMKNKASMSLSSTTIYSPSPREGTKQVLPTPQRAPALPTHLGGGGLA